MATLDLGLPGWPGMEALARGGIAMPVLVPTARATGLTRAQASVGCG
ncbi:hypothetical protein [Paracoccus sp. (in: a-proteobacteria)]